MPWTALLTTFKVYLSPKDHYLPIAWERTAHDGSFRYVYEVRRWQTFTPPDSQETVAYPEVATQEKYLGDSKTPCIKATIQVRNVFVNRRGEENWAISPARAKFIDDMTVKPPRLIPIAK